MNPWVIERYQPSLMKEWNEFTAASRNGTFLFMRGYMDYHSDRFADASLMAYRNGKLMAMLPANITTDGVLHSHQGLTYGGWILPVAHIDGEDVLTLFEALTEYALTQGWTALDYKPVPHIYTRVPAQDDLYALFRAGASLTEANLSSTVDLLNPRAFNTLMRRHLKRAFRLGATVDFSPDSGEFDTLPFWTMLRDCLAERHGAVPVHSAEELQLLRDRFPDKIRTVTVNLPGEENPQAGIVLFMAGPTAHCQYICSTPQGRKLGLLPLLFDRVLTVLKERISGTESVRYLDFGTSNEDRGKILNAGLLRQKASLGGSGVIYQRFRLSFQRKRNILTE